jgi:hypothetical protein
MRKRKERIEETIAPRKRILFLSSQITQQTALRINSTNSLSFNGIQQSIIQISSRDKP